MTDLSKALRERLQELADIRPPAVVLSQPSQDGSCKWLIRLDSGNGIEMVFIPEPGRGTLCVSSQIGCALNCSFCGSHVSLRPSFMPIQAAAQASRLRAAWSTGAMGSWRRTMASSQFR